MKKIIALIIIAAGTAAQAKPLSKNQEDYALQTCKERVWRYFEIKDDPSCGAKQLSWEKVKRCSRAPERYHMGSETISTNPIENGFEFFIQVAQFPNSWFFTCTATYDTEGKITTDLEKTY